MATPELIEVFASEISFEIRRIKNITDCFTFVSDCLHIRQTRF